MSDINGAESAKMARWQGQIEERMEGLRREAKLTRDADKEAVSKALTASEKLAEKHNDLIRQMQERDKNYVSEDVYTERHEALIERIERVEGAQAKTLGGMVVLGIIGISNLIRIWTG
jgi:hypothetical protein